MERLSGLDAVFLYFEKPTMHMHGASTAILDPSTMPGGYEFSKIKAFIGSRLHLVPPYRRRIIEVPLGLNHPIWVEDPDVDLDYHIRRVAVPSPGGREELAELAAQIASTPLDRSRPLWELHVVEGLADGKIGVVSKMHHCAVDGVSGVEMMANLFDREPTGRVLDPPEARILEPIPSDLKTLRQAVGPRARRSVGIFPLLGTTAKTVTTLVSRRRDPDATGPLKAPDTPWNGAITAHRRMSFTQVKLDDIKTIKNRVGCTVNDVVLGLMAGTLRRYLEAHDALPDTPLIAVCPVSVRAESERGQMNNKISVLRTSLATDVDDPVERLRTIIKVTNRAKEDHNALGPNLGQDWAEHLGPTTVALAARLSSNRSDRPICNVLISNVAGPQFPLYYAGAKIESRLPMGIVFDGVGLNITVLSYMDHVDVGFMTCRELIPDVWLLAGYLQEATDELLTATSKLDVTNEPAKKPATASATK